MILANGAMKPGLQMAKRCLAGEPLQWGMFPESSGPQGETTGAG